MKNEPMQHIQFPHGTQVEKDPFMHEVARIAAQVADLTDKALTEAMIAAAKQEGLTDLYLIDRQFLFEAIKEKVEREKNKPLTQDELMQMREATPVWWQYYEKGGFWCLADSGVVMVPSGRCYDISECKGRIYRHKPKEARDENYIDS